MTKRIFRGIFYVSLITMLACLVFVIGVQYQLYDETQSGDLKHTASYLAAGINSSGDEYLALLDKTDTRITLINTDGTVLFDNLADASKMENHAGRSEIQQAQKEGDGTAVRYSETLSAKTCYYAVRLEDGRILRVSSDRSSVLAVLLQLLQPIAAVALLAVILSAVLASVISKKILAPINAIKLDSSVIEESYEELAPLVGKLNAQNRKIKRQIERLTQSRREFEIISGNMSEGLLLTDRECHILMHNKSVERLFGSTDIREDESLLALNRTEEFRAVYDALCAGKHESVSLTLDGHCCDIIANPVFDEDGSLCGGVILIVDVTEKENREKLRREFTANVSHELKTPLTSIYGISDLLKSGMVKPEDVSGFGNDINRESARLITLVNDIIRLSQLDENNSTTLTDRIDLLILSDEVCSRLKPVAEQSKITLSSDGTHCEITGNAALLFEMVYNLCDNGIKYNHEGGTVTVTTGIADEHPFLTVRDTGIGIEKSDEERIFERFYRVDKSRSKQNGGTGLGLSIVKHIAAVHGAQITLESEPGCGTAITVLFPDERKV